MILLLLILSALLAGTLLPAWWVRRVMREHREPAGRYPGTGAELVAHLAGILELDVRVERSDPGADHYDPETRTIRLSPENHDGRSLTAVTVAAHEMGHAIQHAAGMPLFRWRQRLVRAAQRFQRIGMVLVVAGPLVAIALRAPGVMLWAVGAGLAGMLLVVLTHLATLPVELDASFRRALPLLERGGYLKREDRPAARRILRAAAFTYVAQSLSALINLGLWLRVLRP